MFLLALAACSPPPEEGKTKVILGATWIEAGKAPVSPSAIVVSETRVQRAGTQAETPIPTASEKIPAWGKFVIPEPVIADPAAEAARLKQAGRGRDEILAALTVDAARKDETGSLAAGRTASLWLLAADPVESPATLGAPERILKEGQWKK